MKIGVISDTHLPVSAQSIPLKVLEEFKTVDLIIHAGDLVDLSVLEVLSLSCKNILAVCGNMDSREAKQKLPERQIFCAGNYKIGIIHGWGAPDSLAQRLGEFFEKDNLDVIIFGHSHRPMNLKINKILYFNPGSPTDKVYAPYNSFGIIEINDKIEAKIIKI